MKKIIILILLLSFIEMMGMQKAPTVENSFFHHPQIKFGLSKDQLNSYQVGISYSLINVKGIFKNIHKKGVTTEYYLRNNKSKIDHHFRFCLTEIKDLYFNEFLKFDLENTETKLTAYYLFNHSGFKLLDWRNTKENDEVNLFTLTNEFTFEERIHCKDCMFKGVANTSDRNFYFISRFLAGVSYLDYSNNYFSIPKNVSPLYFWDIPLGIDLELGFELWSEKDYILELDNGKKVEREYNFLNTISLFLDLRYYPLENFSRMNYGAKLQIDPGYKYLQFECVYEVKSINVADYNKKFQEFSLCYKLPVKQLVY